MAVKVVTDSASDLPPSVAHELGIAIVPCNVHFGTEELKDGVDIAADEFYQRLVNGPTHPTTSQPSPGDFVEVYDQLGKDADGIVSIHVSSKLSGTYNSAIQGKAQSSATCPIEVVDSTQACVAIGLIAVAAAKEASKGSTVEAVAEVARGAAPRSQLYFLLNTLEYLQKGGRIGKARAMLGAVLNIKPMLIVQDGEVHELGKVRTFSKGIAKLQEVTRGFAPLESLYVLYTTTPDLASEIATSLSDLLPEGQEPDIGRAGPTIGTYVGPGVVGVALLAAETAPADQV